MEIENTSETDFLCYQYFSEKNCWKKIPETTNFDKLPEDQELKISCYNVLIKTYSSLFYNPFYKVMDIERYQYILLESLPKQNPDIIVYLEVQDRFLQILKDSQHIRENYYVSHLKLGHGVNHQAIILSKFPFRFYDLFSHRRILGLFCTQSGKAVTINPIHFNSETENIEIRRS